MVNFVNSKMLFLIESSLFSKKKRKFRKLKEKNKIVKFEMDMGNFNILNLVLGYCGLFILMNSFSMFSMMVI